MDIEHSGSEPSAKGGKDHVTYRSGFDAPFAGTRALSITKTFQETGP